MVATSSDHESCWQVWSIIPDCFSNERKLAHCNCLPNVGDTVEHLEEDILSLDLDVFMFRMLLFEERTQV